MMNSRNLSIVKLSSRENEKPNYWINNLLFDDLSENMRKKLFNHLHKEKLLYRAIYGHLFIPLR